MTPDAKIATCTGASMCGQEMIVEILNSYYGSTLLLKYSESADEIRFQLPAPIRDRQAEAFRSGATVLNELAVSHRLSLLVGRAKYGVPEAFAFAIKSVESVLHSIDLVDEYDVSLRFEVITKRRDTVTALRSTLVTKHGVEARMTTTSFNVLPPALANFVRRSRQFLDFSEVKMSRDKSDLSTVADNHFRYYPSEDDRLSDGKRVDHVPALTLIDIALSVNRMNQGTVDSNISAEFLNYTDPRIAFDIFAKKDQSAIEFVQKDQLLAIVYNRELKN
ncbi:MAG TPA: hypothetical protein VGO68_10570 [Pyrinomonadaceae bacterium]|jgi:hypothetical protein|nr:hypothetical protein [Pyrinomonadaceae bacterium]